MSLRQELASWSFPTAVAIAQSPQVGERAPDHPGLDLPDASVVVLFLRHCGCPYAEKAYRNLCNLPAIRRGEVAGIIVSHSSRDATEKWITAIQNDEKNPLLTRTSNESTQEPHIRVVVDQAREIYAAWGLGLSSAWHLFNPGTLTSAVTLGVKEGIWNRPTESGSRWQTAGEFAVDRNGVVRWSHIYQAAGDVGDLNEAIKAIESGCMLQTGPPSGGSDL